jgi:hypothetical protein
MLFSSFSPIQNFTRHFTAPAKRTHRHLHQIRTKNPAHQSVTCASTYFRMPKKKKKTGSCKNTKQLIVAPVFGFYFVLYAVENKMAL